MWLSSVNHRSVCSEWHVAKWTPNLNQFTHHRASYQTEWSWMLNMKNWRVPHTKDSNLNWNVLLLGTALTFSRYWVRRFILNGDDRSVIWTPKALTEPRKILFPQQRQRYWSYFHYAIILSAQVTYWVLVRSSQVTIAQLKSHNGCREKKKKERSIHYTPASVPAS